MASIGNRVKAAFRTLFGGDAPKSAGGLLAGIMQGGEAPKRGTRELLIAYKRLPRLRAVTHRVASDIASTPLRLYTSKGGAGRKAALRGALETVRKATSREEQGSRFRYAKAQIEDARKAGELREVVDHPFLDLLARPNPALGGFGSLFVSQLHRDLVGEFVWVYERALSGEPLEAWPVPPHWLSEPPSSGRPFYRFSWSGWNKLIPETDILWVRDIDPEMPYGRGTGVATALADELDIDELAAKNIRNWFFNGARMAGIASLEGVSEDEIERYSQMFDARHRGVGREHRIHWTNGKLQFQELNQSFKDQELTALRAFEADTVRETFGVPPEVLGIIENSNRATIEASYFLYSMGVLVPRMDFLVGALEPLLDEWGEGLILDYISPVPEDREFKRSIFAQAPAGTFTRNEHRALGSMAPVEGGDEEAKQAELFQYHFQFGIVTINEARARLGLPPLPDGDKPPDPLLMGGLGPTAMAGDPPWVKALPRRKDITTVEVDAALEALRPERLTKETEPVWESKVFEWGEKVLEELGVSVSFNMRNPLVRDIIEQAGTRIKGVTDTTRDALRATLNEGVYAGEGIRELAARVRATFEDATGRRAEMIARTEVVGSSNRANLVAFEVSGVVEQKAWLSVRDGNTRAEHLEMDGQTVELRGYFKSPDGHTARHPGGFGRPEMDINCRCTLVPVVSDPKTAPVAVVKRSEEELSAMWKKFDAELVPWEKAALEALKRGFKAQEAEVLAVLERLA